jgi:hypothetical protein
MERGLGADDRIRTGDLLITNQLLYQLSYVGLTLVSVSSDAVGSKGADGIVNRASRRVERRLLATKKPPGNRAAFSLRENSSNGGKAIRTFWRNSMVGKTGCQGKIRRSANR